MKRISKLNKEFSTLGFGGASISGEGRGYGFGDISESKAEELLLLSYEHGVNIFDFAPIYGFNLAEIRAGRGLKKVREKVHLISKSGVDWHDNGRVNMSNDPKIAIKMLNQSLKNFNCDYIDIYLIHWPDSNVDIRRPLEALYNEKEKGKILHLGLCNTNIEDLRKAKEVCPVEVIQMEANLFRQQTFKELDQECDESILKIGWGTYDKGILSGSVRADSKFDSSDCRSWAPWWKKSDWKDKVQFVDGVCSKMDINYAELANFALNTSQQIVDVSLCGMKTQKHILSNLENLNTPCKGVEEVADEFTAY